MDLSRRGRGRWLGVAAVAAATLTLAACGGSGETKTAAPATSKAPNTNADFLKLVADAKASDHKVRQALSSETAEGIKKREEAFEKRFGFPLILESEPGHVSVDMPPKIIQSAASGRGVIDVSAASAVNFAPVFEQGLMRKPNWAALESEWPIIKTLRQYDLAAVKNTAGEPWSDYCMLHAQAPWLPVVNTGKLDPKKLAGMKWEDLTKPEWNRKMVLDANALGLYVFPFAPEWDVARLTKFTQGLGANNPTIAPGGSTGVLQSLLQGEGDLGMAAFGVIQRQKDLGAPVEFVIPTDFVPVDIALACLIKPGVNNAAMTELYLAWYNAEGIYQDASTVRFGTGEEQHFPIAKAAADVGITVKKLAAARNVEENKAIAGFRDIAKKGITTKP